MNSQTAKIQAHLDKGLCITAMEALDLYQCFRLAARISDLKDKNYPVDKQMIQLENGKYVAEYFKVKE